MKNFSKVFIAGTIQGANRNATMHNQDYREIITRLVLARYPDALCFDPSREVVSALSDPRVSSLVSAAHAQPVPAILPDTLPPELTRLRDLFARMTQSVEDCDLCIAYLPDHVPSMGTAMEMYAAFLSGVPVVAVTDMVDNLAIMSVSSCVLRDLDSLDAWLTEPKLGAPALSAATAL